MVLMVMSDNEKLIKQYEQEMSGLKHLGTVPIDNIPDDNGGKNY